MERQRCRRGDKQAGEEVKMDIKGTTEHHPERTQAALTSMPTQWMVHTRKKPWRASNMELIMKIRLRYSEVESSRKGATDGSEK